MDVWLLFDGRNPSGPWHQDYTEYYRQEAELMRMAEQWGFDGNHVSRA